MYSTLLFLDRPRHLRYDIQAIVDLDQLLPNGFKTVFTMPATIESLKIIFWAGLKHEDKELTFDQVADILSKGLEHGWTIEKYIEIFSKSIWNQGWISRSQEKSDKPLTLETLINDMETINYKYFHMHPRDFYALTPQEFITMMDTWNVESDHDLALLCTTIANCSGATKSGGVAFIIDDFMPRKKQVRQSSDQMKNILIGAFGG
jgi:hypothetical protein